LCLPPSLTRPRPPALLSASIEKGRPFRPCEGYSPIFCETLARFNDSDIPAYRAPAADFFALFLLVRDVSILDPLIAGSRDFFTAGFFDRVFVFNEENRSGAGAVAGVAVEFVDVRPLWSAYPPGFDPNATESHWVVRDVKWGYHQMIRFFWHTVFTLPAVANVTAYMRLDGDSCLFQVRESPRSLLADGVVYVKNDAFVDVNSVVENLEPFVRDYVAYFNIAVRGKRAWDAAYFAGCALAFYNNLELMDVRFWMRPDVQHFVAFVDASWGIYRHRWGDAPLRYIALAIFADESMVRDRPASWVYDHPCRVN
jgi:hypothetical protein